jgi:hypothetical protein
LSLIGAWWLLIGTVLVGFAPELASAAARVVGPAEVRPVDVVEIKTALGFLAGMIDLIFAVRLLRWSLVL